MPDPANRVHRVSFAPLDGHRLSAGTARPTASMAALMSSATMRPFTPPRELNQTRRATRACDTIQNPVALPWSDVIEEHARAKGRRWRAQVVLIRLGRVSLALQDIYIFPLPKTGILPLAATSGVRESSDTNPALQPRHPQAQCIPGHADRRGVISAAAMIGDTRTSKNG